MKRTIRVTGKGKIALKPDTIEIYITQKNVEHSYENAIRESAAKKEELLNALKKLGFQASDLKTSYFNVNTEYEGYSTVDKSWRQRLVGYKYTHRMKLEFPADNKRLGEVLYVLAKCAGSPEFSIEYTVEDREAAKNALLAKAVEDSRAKAEVLTKAAGVSLQKILNIDYSWGEINLVSRPINDMMLKCSMSDMSDCSPNSIDIDIEADDIEVTDTVTIIWEIG